MCSRADERPGDRRGPGFIGAALVERLVAGGHFVAVVDDGSSGGRRLHGLHGEAAFMEADVSRTPTSVISLRRRSQRRWVHLAARADVGESLCAPCRGPW